MKFYIASTFSLISKIIEIEEQLEKMGHEITVKWWRRAYGSDGSQNTNDLKKVFASYSWQEFMSKPEVEYTYHSDKTGILDADGFIFVADELPRKFNGASVELGMALQREIPCYLIGELEPSCLFYPLIKIDSVLSIESDIKRKQK